MAILTVTHTESVFLNNRERGGTNTYTFNNIDKVDERIVNVDDGNTATSTDWTTLAVFAANSEGEASVIDRDEVQYIRVSNLDATNYVIVSIVATSTVASVKLLPQESFILGRAAPGAVGEGDGVPSAVPKNIDRVTSIANTANCNVEIFIASGSYS